MFRPDLQAYTLLEPRANELDDGSVGSPANAANAAGVQKGRCSPAFVEDDNFQCFIGLVIFLNIVVLWGETDAPNLGVWVVFDNIFLVIFLVEIVLRLLHHKLVGYYCGKDKWWAYLDTAIVCLGIFDLWLTPLCMAQFGYNASSKSALLRFLRLMRLLRLLRVFKMFSQLMTFVNALINMLGQFIWIFSVLFLFILCFGIILTHLLGHAEAFSRPAEVEVQHPEALRTIRSYFQDVPTSLFTLFQLTTTDNWDDIAYPLVEIDPWWRLFFVFFIAFASWTMISVLTAVASDNMIAATSDRKDLELKEQEAKHLQFIEFLKISFQEADVDGNGVLDKEEFRNLMGKDFVHRRMKELGIHLSQDELFKAWDMLDIDESGELTIEEFVTGLSYLQEGLATKHIVNVDYSLKRVTVRCEGRMEKITSSMGDILRQNETILEALKLQEQTQAAQLTSLKLWQNWALSHEFGTFLGEHLPMAQATANDIRRANAAM